jgi:hypothetical protein
MNVGFLYLIPPVASAVMLGLLWSELTHPRLVGACWLVGVLLQFVVGEPFNVGWLAGLVLNAALGVGLAIRLKMA